MALSAKELQSFSSRITKSISPSTASNPRVTQLREQTNQVLSQGPQMIQQPKAVVNAPIKVAQPNIVQSNASWIGGQVNQNVAQPLVSTAKKIGSNITAKLVAPQSTMLKDAGIDTAKVETLKLKPNQKKLAPEQLQKVAGAQAVMKTRDKEEVNRVALDTKNKIKAIQEQFRTKTTEEVRRELPKDYKKPNMIKSVAETLALSFVSLGQNIGGSLEQLGNAAGGSTGGGLGAKFLLTNAGKKLAQESENIIASNPEWVKESNVENWGVEKVAKLATAAAPSILVNIGATILGGPAGSYLSAYLLEAGGTYREAKKAGKSENEAQLYATTVGVVNSYLEKKFPDELFKGQKIVMKKQLSVLSKQYAREMVRVAKEYTKRFVGGGTLEAGMEVMQEIVANTVAQAYDKTRKIHDNLLESAVGAFFSAGPIAVAGTGNVKTIINEGEHTPQAVIGQVIANKQENTVEGKELLKTAVEAQQKGQNVLIETTKEGKVDSEVTTVNQEETMMETKTEKPKVEYTAGAIKKIQTQMDEILGVDPNMKNFKMKQKLWGESFMITDQAANAGDKDAIADIEKLVALQIQLEDMRDARQSYLKNKKTKKSAKDYVEGKVKERSVKFRETKEVKQIRKLQGDELLLAIENNIDKVADISKNKLQAVDDFVELEDISKKLLKGKEKPADITTAYEILQRNGIDIGQQVEQTANEYVAQKGPKFREDTSKPLTLEEIKAQNAAAKQESAKTGQENAEDTAEKVMGWKTGDQKREFDAAMNKKDAAKVREMLPNVPEYFKTEFKQEIDEVLNNDFTEEGRRTGPKFREGSGDEMLINEARKYNSEEEFIKLQGQPLYHGTNQDFETFNKASRGNMTKAVSAKRGTFFTDSMKEAEAYAEAADNRLVANEKKFNRELKTLQRKQAQAEARAQITRSNEDWQISEELTQKIEDFYFDQTRDNPVKNARVVEAYAKLNNPLVVDFMDGTPKDSSTGGISKLILQAQREGHDGLIMKNITDAPIPLDSATTQTVIFDTDKIKTRKQLIDIWNQANNEKFRLKDDFEKATGIKITNEQEEKIKDLNNTFFKDDDVRITYQIMANKKALGQYYQKMIDILDGQADPVATYLHEAVHKYLDVFATSEEYIAILEEGAKKYKTDDFAEVEERIAEDFINYARNSIDAKVSGKTKSLFDKIIERIKIYFGNKSAIDRLYNDIVEGKAAKKATKTAQETAPGQKTDIPTNQVAQTPVGEGDKTKSKAYTRVYDRLAEEAQQDVSYNKLNLEKDTQNALEFITTDPKAAIRVGLGLEEAPQGQTETAISIALADKAGRDGDFALQSQLESSRSLRQTRRGQEIVSERGRFNEDSPHFFIRELMDMRLKNLGSSLTSSLEELQGKAKSVKKAAIEKIDKGVSKLKNKIKADRKKITLAQDIIDSIIC